MKPVLEPLLTPADRPEGWEPHELRGALTIQAQWEAARPEQVRYLQWKGKLKEALRSAAGESYSTMETLMDGNVPAGEAQKEGLMYVALPPVEDSPRLPSRLSPYGQPSLRSRRSGSATAT